jgi:hypothetical protein
MKIPIFEEILLKGTGLKDILAVVEDSRIGKVPCYINFTNYNSEDLNNTVMNLEQIILENALHPRFPYPLYIIATRPVNTLFPTVRSVKQLPEHYFKKVKRPNNKELQLLNKLMLKVDKIKNLQLYKITDELKHSADTQKRLYNETKELYFLENIYSTLFEKNVKGKGNK